jgi:hypothetical protein
MVNSIPGRELEPLLSQISPRHLVRLAYNLSVMQGHFYNYKGHRLKANVLVLSGSEHGEVLSSERPCRYVVWGDGGLQRLHTLVANLTTHFWICVDTE